MVFEDEGSFVRQMMVRVMGREGGIDDAVYLSVFLDSTKNPKFNCPSKARVIYGGREHVSDSDEKVLEAAIEAIGRIISREAEKPGSALVNGDLGERLAGCALLDGSEKVRETAAEILWNHSDKTAILMLMKEFSDAEASGNLYISTRAEDAVKKAADAMGKARVRGTALGPLIDAASEDGKPGTVASDVLVRLAKMEKEVVAWIKKKKAATNVGNDLGEGEKARKVRRLAALIDRIGLVSESAELPPPPQLNAGPDVKPTRNMRPIAAPKKEDDELIHVPGDPIGNWWRRVKYRRQQKKMEQGEAPEKRMTTEGTKRKR
jgi:hypothetical protein